MMCDEVYGCFVSENSILFDVVILVSKSTNYTISTKGLVHEWMHRGMKGVTNSMKLVVNAKIWFHYVVEEDNETSKEDYHPIAEINQDEEDTSKSESIIQDSVEAVK